MHTTDHSFGPRLIAQPTGALRAAVLVATPPAIEEARPLAGEPNAVHARAAAAQNILIKTLEYFGCATTLLDPQTNDPYASVVVDAAIAFENGAVMMRPSSMLRRAEVAWLEEAFMRRDIPIAGHIAEPGVLDGSDVLMAGNTAFVGVSKRCNAAGRAGFSKIARAHGFTVVEVALANTTRCLRSVAGVVSRDSMAIASSQHLDHAAFAGFTKYIAQAGNELGAGVLNLGERHVLADMRFPGVVDMLRAAGVVVEAIDLYDFARVGIAPSMLVADLKRV